MTLLHRTRLFKLHSLSVVTTEIKAITQELKVLLFNPLCTEEVQVFTQQYKYQNNDNVYERLRKFHEMENFHSTSVHTTILFLHRSLTPCLNVELFTRQTKL